MYIFNKRHLCILQNSMYIKACKIPSLLLKKGESFNTTQRQRFTTNERKRQMHIYLLLDCLLCSISNNVWFFIICFNILFSKPCNHFKNIISCIQIFNTLWFFFTRLLCDLLTLCLYVYFRWNQKLNFINNLLENIIFTIFEYSSN